MHTESMSDASGSEFRDENVVRLSRMISARIQSDLQSMSLSDIRMAEGELTSAVVVCRSALNAAVPVHRLPPELLKTIFALVPTLYYQIKSSKNQTNIVDVWKRRHYARMSELYTLMLVCRQWRDIVTGTQLFWNTIDQAHTLTQTMFLERSGYGPLKVVLRNLPSASMSTLCDGESARIVQIHHTGVSGGTAEEYLGFPAPALEVLNLTNSWFFGRRTLTESGQTVHLFRGHTPRLRQLSLHHVHWFPAVQVTALTHLNVDMCRWDDLLVKIMGILASAQGLTDLVLSSLSCITPDIESLNAAYPDGSVPLPHLKRLHMRYVHSEEAVMGVLAKLSLPPTTAIDIAKAMDARDFSENFLSTLSRLPVMQTVSCASLVLASAEQERQVTLAQLMCFGAESGLVCTPLGLRHGLSPMTAVIPVRQIRELWLTLISDHGDPPFLDVIDRQPAPVFEIDPDVLGEFLRPMAALETLVVWGHVLPNVLEGLVDHDATATRPLCPKLSHLRVMLSGKSPLVDELMTLLDAQQDILRLKDVEINYLPSYTGPKVENTEHDHHFPSIQYISRKFVPIIAMPPVCKQEAHARWTVWMLDEDGLQLKEDGESRDGLGA